VKQHLPASCFDFEHLSVSPAEVFEELSSLNTHKACGPDQIYPRLLKEGADVLAPSLAKLFNKSLCDGVLSQDWVSANVTPVYKKSSKQHVSNYRPISLTSVVCKILEKLIHHKLYRLLNPIMYFVIPSLVFVLIDLPLATTHDWAKTLDDHQSSHYVFIDYVKAFDSVPHERLLLKLEAYGVHEPLLQWFRSFFTTRRQRVVINGNYSDWRKVSSGVPQRSVLGSLLFILYINDLSCVIKSKTKIFADDVIIYRKVVTHKDCAMLQGDLYI